MTEREKLADWFEPALGKVDLKQQILYTASPIIFTVFCILVVARFAGWFSFLILPLGLMCTIPFFVRPFLRIKKFWRMIIMTIVPFIILFFGVYLPYSYPSVRTTVEPVIEVSWATIFTIFFVAAVIVVPIYLIIRWTKQWNKQFERLGSE